jgi:hypothetical protein
MTACFSASATSTNKSAPAAAPENAPPAAGAAAMARAAVDHPEGTRNLAAMA